MIPSLMILTGSLIILALAGYWFIRAEMAEAKLRRIIALETERMAHVGKVAVAIAKGER